MEFLSENNDYTISININKSIYTTFYTFKFINNLGRVVKEILISKSDILILLDNIETCFYYNYDSIYTNIDSSKGNILFGIQNELDIYTGYKRIYLVVDEYIQDSLQRIIKIEVSNTIDNFLYLLTNLPDLYD